MAGVSPVWCRQAPLGTNRDENVCLGWCCFGYLMLQVKQLRMDKQVLAAHEAATSALKACREAQGLTVELVEDTLDAFAEVTCLFLCMSRGLCAPLVYGNACSSDRVERCAEFVVESCVLACKVVLL